MDDNDDDDTDEGDFWAYHSNTILASFQSLSVQNKTLKDQVAAKNKKLKALTKVNDELNYQLKFFIMNAAIAAAASPAPAEFCNKK